MFTPKWLFRVLLSGVGFVAFTYLAEAQSDGASPLPTAGGGAGNAVTPGGAQQLPTGVPSPVPTVSPEDVKAPIKPEGAGAAEEAKNWHEGTPPQLDDRLRVGLSVGMGWGKGPGITSWTATDLLAFRGLVEYTLEPPSQKGNKFSRFAGFQYMSWNITDKSPSVDASYAVQSLTGHFGLDINLNMPFLVSTSGGLGLARVVGMQLGSGSAVTPKHGFFLAADGRIRYLIREKWEGFGGVEVRLGSWTWFDIHFGLQGSF